MNASVTHGGAGRRPRYTPREYGDERDESRDPTPEHRERPEWDQRIDRFAQHLVKTAKSTDAEEIAAVARECGASVPFLRDATLADDQIHVSAVTLDALDRVDPGVRVQGVAQLLANCPLRTAEDVISSFEQFERTGALSQISVTQFGWQNPWWASELTPAGAMAPIFPERMTSRSQDLPALFCPTGAIWWARPEVLRRTGTFHVPGRTGWVIPWQRAVDIDTEDDWQMAEQLLRLSRAGEPTHVC